MDEQTKKGKGAGKTAPKRAEPGLEETFMDRVKMFLAPRVRELKFNMHLLSKSATSIAGLILLTLLIVVAAFPWAFAEPTPGTDPYFMPFNRFLPDPLPPLSEGFLLGSGNNGADIYYGIVWGARISMSFSIQVVLASVLIGTLLGIFSGYKGGFVDELIMRITDVFLSIPSLILVMAIAAVLGRDLNATKLALIMVWWSGYTRLIRGQVLSIKENSYIDAARAAGSSEGKIMLKHIFPNSLAPLLVAATMDMGTVVLVMAGLSYLGLGAEHGMAEWGVMINDGQRYFVIGYWWMVFFPGMAILTFVMAFNLLGDGLRDIFDPKMRR